MQVIDKGDPECPAFWWGKDKPIEPLVPVTWEVRPVEIHIKEDGSVNNEPSLCFVLYSPSNTFGYAQISWQMLKPAIEEIIKRNPNSLLTKV